MALELSDARFKIGSYLASVDAMLAQGGVVTDEFEKIRAGWKVASSDPTEDELQAHILDAIKVGDTEAVDQAMTRYAVAKLDHAHVRGRIARAVLPALRTAYQASSADNYAGIAKRYDEAAGRLTKCAAVVDITLDADQVVALDAKQRTAWMDSAAIAKEVDQMLAVLVDAATLAGIPDTDSNLGTRIALCCDPGTAHRRRVFQAWKSKARCGKWAGLLALGVTLRAASLDGFEPYADPAPITIRQVPVNMGAGVHGTRQVPVDPEDAAYTAAHASAR